MKKNTTQTSADPSYSLLSNIGERLAYGLATLLFCIVPFLIPGITIRQGVEVFFGALLLLVVGIIVFSVMHGKKMSNNRK